MELADYFRVLRRRWLIIVLAGLVSGGAALGYSLSEAREASRAALADVGVSSSLEERVKAALRSLLRE